MMSLTEWDTVSVHVDIDVDVDVDVALGRAIYSVDSLTHGQATVVSTDSPLVLLSYYTIHSLRRICRY